LYVILDIATAVGVTFSGAKVCAATPRTVVARTVAVAAVMLVVNVVVLAATVVLKGPKSWFGVILDPASVGTIDDRFVSAGITIATVLEIGGNFVLDMELINDDPPGLQVSGCDAPKIASNKYATRDPAVRPML
jgi:hypothetical protein